MGSGAPAPTQHCRAVAFLGFLLVCKYKFLCQNFPAASSSFPLLGGHLLALPGRAEWPQLCFTFLFHVRGWETQTFEGSCSVCACTFLSRGNAGWEFLSGLLAAVWPCVTALPSCCRRVPPSEQGLGCLLWTRGYKHKAAVLGVFVFFRWPPLLNLKNTQAMQ